MLGLFKKHKKKHGIIGRLTGLLTHPHLPFGIAGTAIIAVVLGYLLRPLIHDLLMELYTRPSVLIFLGLVAFGGSIWKWVEHKPALVTWAVSIIFLLSAIYSTALVEVYVEESVDYKEVQGLPQTSEFRILPKQVAEKYMGDSLKESGQKLGELDLVLIDNSILWTAPKVPDGYFVYFVKKVDGLLTASADRTERKTGVIKAELKVGEEIGLTDNILWKVYVDDYWVKPGDIYYAQDFEEIVTIVPLIKYRFKFPAMVPYFAGVYVFKEDGSFEKLSSSQVGDMQYLEENRAFPAELARLNAEGYKYKLGLWNALATHEDQTEITDIAGPVDQQPFYVITEQGNKWVVVAEPFGESTGISKVFLIDAVTGSTEVFTAEDALTGPVKVVSLVKKEFPQIDWAQSRVVEPRPVFLGNKFYWMVSIVTKDFEGVLSTVFVDAGTNEVIGFERDAELKSFIFTGQAQAAKGQTRKETTKIDEIQKLLKELKELNE